MKIKVLLLRNKEIKINFMIDLALNLSQLEPRTRQGNYWLTRGC